MHNASGERLSSVDWFLGRRTRTGSVDTLMNIIPATARSRPLIGSSTLAITYA